MEFNDFEDVVSKYFAPFALCGLHLIVSVFYIPSAPLVLLCLEYFAKHCDVWHFT